MKMKPIKPTCDFCGDTILGEIHFIDYPYKGNRWDKSKRRLLTKICSGCRLMLEEKGIIGKEFIKNGRF